MVTVEDIREGAREVGLSGRAVCAHSSLRSFGWVEGGAATVVNGLLEEGCTVMVPTFSWRFGVPPPPGRRPPRNGWDYEAYEGPTSGIGRIYTPESHEIGREAMGAIPAYVLTIPGRLRGIHPLCSFAAVGPLASELISRQTPLDVFGHLKALGEMNGLVVMMGVPLTTMTLLHLAEQRAGRNSFRRWANGPDGRVMETACGGCSDGFDNFEPLVGPLAEERKVGESLWRVFIAEDVVAVAAEAIRQNPGITHCGKPECERCNDSVLGGPILD